MGKLKKLTAFLLAAATAFSYMPQAVYANVQSPVKNFTMSNLENKPNSDKFNVSWNQPLISKDTYGGLPAEVGGKPDKTEGYDVKIRNASASEAYDLINTIKDNGGNYYSLDYESSTLESGSLYAVQVTPYHVHPKQNFNKVDYETEIIYGPASEGLYMSDIKVEAMGSGGNFTVKWDNPTFDGKDVFSGYKIYLEYEGNSTGTFISTKTISMNQLIRDTGSNKVSYILDDISGLVGTRLYRIYVEPLNSSGSPVRGGDGDIGDKKIKIDNKEYPLIYKDRKQVPYDARNVLLDLELTVDDYDLDNVILKWKPRLSEITNIEGIEKINIYESNSPNFDSPTLIGTLGEDAARSSNSFLASKPDGTKYYQIEIVYKNSNITTKSNIAVYKPKDMEFDPYKPIIREINDNIEELREGGGQLNLEVKWDAFLRTPYNNDEKELIDSEGLFLDKDVTYTVWITDDADNFSDPNFEGFPIGKFLGEDLETGYVFDSVDNKNKTVYINSFTEFMQKNGKEYSQMPIADNKIYYVKIVAQRNNIVPPQISEPAYGSHYIFPLDTLDNRPVSVSRPPFRIKTVNGVQEITDTTITVEWDTTWFEIYKGDNSSDSNIKEESETNSWYAYVGVDSAGNIVYGDDAGKVPEDKRLYLYDKKYYDFKDEPEKALDNIRKDLKDLGAKPTMVDLLPIRKQSFRPDVKYELHWVEAEKVGSGYQNYYDNLKGSGGESLWQTVEPTGEPLSYTIEGLTPNTQYLIFFRPYYENSEGEKQAAYMPSAITGTTLPVRPPIEIIPTVPNLEVVETKDFSIRVRWEYSSLLGYELAIAEKSGEDPVEGSIFYTWDEIKASPDFKIEKDYVYFTFDNLFPDTMYYMWIRAYSESPLTGEPLYSAWSNPVSAKTLDILPPDPPKGLGPASDKSLNAYNRENDTSYKAFGKDESFGNYMIVEWLRNVNDKTDEVPTGTAGEPPKSSWLSSVEVPASYLSMFGDLIPNKDYYIRAKTVLVVTRGAGNEVNKSYHYIVQISPDAEFVDIVEIKIPPMADDLQEGTNTKIRESEWSNTIVLYALSSDDEYDGDKNPNLYPLPTEDFEIIYDNLTNTLTYRYRSDGQAADGTDDNFVDQRLISRLIKEKIYDYKIEMTNYENRTIKNRIIELPYSVINAFDERKVNMVIYADNLTLTIPHNSLKTKEVKGLSDYGRGASVKITLTPNATDIPALGANEFYASGPHKLSMTVKTPTKTVNISKAEKELGIDMKLNNRFTTVDYNIKNYYSDGNSGGYSVLKTEYDKVPGLMKAKTKVVGNFAAIAAGVTPADTTSAIDLSALNNVNSRLKLEGINNYNPDTTVNTTQFNNIVSAVVSGQPSVKVNEALSEEKYASLGKGGLLTSGTVVTREAGIAALTRLYELKTKSAIKDYQSASPSDLGSAGENYKVLLQKAYAIELFEGDLIKPSENLKFGDFLNMLDIVLSDIDY